MGEGGIGLIAGGGALPREAAACLANRRIPYVAFGFAGLSDPALVQSGDALRLGQVEGLLARLREKAPDSLLIVGHFDPELASAPSPAFMPDDTARRLLADPRHRSPVEWMAAIADWLDREGFPLARQDELLAPLLARVGPIGARTPSPRQVADAEVGRSALASQTETELGQAVAVADGRVVAREDLEGTDALIMRVAARGGAGVTIVKGARPGQDPRLDLPAIGPRTMEGLARAGGVAMAVQAGATLVIEADVVEREARSADMVVWGFDPIAATGGA